MCQEIWHIAFFAPGCRDKFLLVARVILGANEGGYRIGSGEGDDGDAGTAELHMLVAVGRHTRH